MSQHYGIIVLAGLALFPKAVNNKEGSVVYYINIDEPLKKGDTVELLVNYKVSLMEFNRSEKI